MHQIHHESDDYLISSDPLLIQPNTVHNYLANESYWAKHISYDIVSLAIANSFCIGIYRQDEQIGFSRIVTDYATFGYLADVFILPEHRGKGLSKQMMQEIMKLPWIGKLRRFALATVDAHGLYSQFGFRSPEHPERLMEIAKKGLYEQWISPGNS